MGVNKVFNYVPFSLLITDDLISSVTFHPDRVVKINPAFTSHLCDWLGPFVLYRSETMVGLRGGWGGSPGSPWVQFKKFT